MSRQELSRRLDAVGCRLADPAIREIEIGKRKVSLAEFVCFAYALEVSPMTLLLPEADAPTAEIPGTGLTASAWLAWLRGYEPFGLEVGERGGLAKVQWLVRSRPPWEVDPYIADIEATVARRQKEEQWDGRP